MRKLVDEALAKEISEIITRYYSQKLDRQLSNETLADAEEIAAAAESIGGPAAEAIQSRLGEQHSYVVVASLPPEDASVAIQRAEALRKNGYDAQVHHSTSGYSRRSLTLSRMCRPGPPTSSPPMHA